MKPVTHPDQLHAVFAERFNKGDVEGLLALYEPGATLVPNPVDDSQTAVGLDAIRHALGPFLALKGKMVMTTVRCIVSGELAFTSGAWKVDGTGPDGKPVHLEGRSVEVLRRQKDGSWKHVIDHPFGTG